MKIWPNLNNDEACHPNQLSEVASAPSQVLILQCHDQISLP